MSRQIIWSSITPISSRHELGVCSNEITRQTTKNARRTGDGERELQDERKRGCQLFSTYNMNILQIEKDTAPRGLVPLWCVVGVVPQRRNSRICTVIGYIQNVSASGFNKSSKSFVPFSDWLYLSNSIGVSLRAVCIPGDWCAGERNSAPGPSLLFCHCIHVMQMSVFLHTHTHANHTTHANTTHTPNPTAPRSWELLFRSTLSAPLPLRYELCDRKDSHLVHQQLNLLAEGLIFRWQRD